MSVLIDLSELSLATKKRLAKETHSPVLLAELAKEDDEEIKRLVANNAYCGFETLIYLAHGEDLKSNQWLILYEVARNPSTRIDLLIEIFKKCKECLNEISKNPSKSDRIYLSQATMNVLDAILQNPNVSESMKKEISDIQI